METIEIVPIEERPGYYLDSDGEWRMDRRSGVERRTFEAWDEAYRDERRFIRRSVDREILRFLDAAL